MAAYTRLTNLEVTGDLKAEGVTLPDLASVTRPTEFGSSYDKDKANALVTAVNAILTALGTPTT